MNREKFKKQVAAVLEPFSLASTMYDGKNIVAVILTEKGAKEAVYDYANKNELFTREFGGVNIILSKTPFEPIHIPVPKRGIDDVLRAIEVAEPNEVVFISPAINKVDDAIHALMDVEKSIPDAISIESAIQHTIVRLGNLRERLNRKTYTSQL